METWKFLIAINGIYNIGEELQNYNLISTLLVYIDKRESTLKIEYAEIEYLLEDINKEPLKIKKGEIILKNIGASEISLITTNINEYWCKELILSKYVDYFSDSLNYKKIY